MNTLVSIALGVIGWLAAPFVELVKQTRKRPRAYDPEVDDDIDPEYDGHGPRSL